MADIAPPHAEDILDMRQKAQDYWAEPIKRFGTMVEVYHGNFQKLWPGEFRRGEAPKVANFIKLAWNRYAAMVGKVPTTHVTPSRISRVSQAQADKVEKIQAHYDATSVMSKTMRQWAWYLIGMGAGPIGVVPDPVLKGPKFIYKDPRSVLVAPGWGSVSTSASHYSMLMKPDMNVLSMPWVIFNEVVTTSYLIDHFPDKMDRIYSLIDKDPFTPVEMITYIDKDWWITLVNQKVLTRVQHSFGFVPFRYTTMSVPDQLGGESMFEQNIGLVLAYMRTLNQKLAYNDNIVWPWLTVRGPHHMDTNSRVIELMDRDGEAGFLSPPGEIQAERDLEVLDRLIRIMNEDTESLRGEAPGSTVTGRGLSELNRTVTSKVQDFWENMKPDLEFVRSAALIIDEEMYAGRKKPMMGRHKGESFEEEYDPSSIKGHHSVSVDFGIGVGGFEGFVEMMQLAAQGYMDEQSVMERAPWIRSVTDTRRKVMLDRLERLMFEMMGGGAPTEMINHLAAWRSAIESGKDPWKWIEENPLPPPAPPEGLPPEQGLGPEGALPPGAAPPQGQPPAVPAPSPRQILALAQGRGQ